MLSAQLCRHQLGTAAARRLCCWCSSSAPQCSAVVLAPLFGLWCDVVRRQAASTAARACSASLALPWRRARQDACCAGGLAQLRLVPAAAFCGGRMRAGKAHMRGGGDAVPVLWWRCLGLLCCAAAIPAALVASKALGPELWHGHAQRGVAVAPSQRTQLLLAKHAGQLADCRRAGSRCLVWVREMCVCVRVSSGFLVRVPLRCQLPAWACASHLWRAAGHSSSYARHCAADAVQARVQRRPG